ncbi:MAG: response regulator, partial [Verrucomicrobiota bacterium]|nr:response regulator [Verrucomicrobiota bacterium]
VKTPLLDPGGNITGIQCMFWDVTERHQIEEQLACERDLLSALLDNVPDRIYIKDTESRFIKGSAALAKRLGLNSTEDFIGKTDYDFHPSDQAKNFHEDEQRVILTGNPIVNKVEQQTDETGRDIWASVTKVPFSNRSGIITGIIGISRDITALKLAERETVRARDLALEAAQMKARFLAVMSHEIRTPMNGIIGMIDLLLASDLSDEQNEYADTVRTSADALLDILNDILDLSKIEAGRLELEKTAFSLRKVLEEAVELHALRAESNHIELNCFVPSNLDMQYSGDAGRLRQILLNLISNAVKFTEKGEVQASVQLLEDTEQDARLQFTVQDSGIGISPEMIEKVFDAFRQADGSTTRRYGGTGLGLSISKQLAEMMDGEMWVESKPGTGSQFHFSVLLKKTATPQHAYADELNGKNFLVVVPNKFARTSISSYAENIGLCVSSKPSGKTAREALNKDQIYDLILLDLNLKDVDCLDLVQEIQANPKQDKSKIVLLTTRKHKVDASILKTLGIGGTLLKPVRLDRLHQSLHSALTGKSHSSKPIMELDGGNHGSLRILVAEDNPINQRVATLQLTKLGHRVDICEDGQAVLDSDLDDFDIILMDCQMPVLDGLEATRKLRETELSTKNTKPVYIIAMTANTQEDDRAACLEAGMDDFISKPVQLKELHTALNRSLGIKPESTDNNLKKPLLASAQINQLRGNGLDDEFKEIISMYIDQTREQLCALEKSVNEKDIASISSKAHQIKGSSANLGAVQISDLCSLLEDNAKVGNLSSSEQLLNEIYGTFDRTKVQLLALLEE